MDLDICVYPLGVFLLDIMYMLFLYVFFGLFIYVIASIVLQYSRLVGYRSEKEIYLLLR